MHLQVAYDQHHGPFNDSGVDLRFARSSSTIWYFPVVLEVDGSISFVNVKVQFKLLEEMKSSITDSLNMPAGFTDGLKTRLFCKRRK